MNKLFHAIFGAAAAALVLAIAMAASGSAQTPAAKDAKEDHHALHDVMEELLGNYLRVANALMHEDFAELEKSGSAIHHHPMPQKSIAGIKSKLGKRFAAFQAADAQVHNGAADLVKRAAAKDIVGATRAFSNVTAGCISCHRQFRPALKGLY